MKKYGFECEYWVSTTEDATPILVPASIPADECGYLAEVRGEPHTDALMAAYMMLAEEDRLRYKAANFVAGKCALVKTNPTRQLTLAFKQDALRRHGKNAHPIERGNIYGKDYNPKDSLSRAGLHVHFSNVQDITWTANLHACKECGYVKQDKFQQGVPQQQDIAKIVRVLDMAFAEAIKVAKRLPGFYELKPHGFEYRSLPASVDPITVARVIIEKGL
jgi:hypothetical protein